MKECKFVCMYVCICTCSTIPALTARYARGKPHPRMEGAWHTCRLVNYPWVELRPAKHLGARISLIGENLGRM